MLFLLEEMGTKYNREDYGRQFKNTDTDAYRTLNPDTKVPTLVDGDVVIWESNSILRYLAAGRPELTGATPAEKASVERWMDWQLAQLNPPDLAVFRDARKAPAERSADFPPRAPTSWRCSNFRQPSGGQAIRRTWPPHARRHLPRPHHQALPRISDREAARFRNCRRRAKAIEARPAFATATKA